MKADRGERPEKLLVEHLRTCNPPIADSILLRIPSTHMVCGYVSIRGRDARGTVKGWGWVSW